MAELMATVYRRIKGDPIQRLIARTQEVQTALSEEAANGARRARVQLAHHRHSGDSYIEVEKGHIDRYVVLNDTRGQQAAAAIENGHWRRTGEVDHHGNEVRVWVEGVHALSSAFRRGG